MLCRSAGSKAVSSALLFDFSLSGARANSSSAAPTWYQEIIADKGPKKTRKPRTLKPSVQKPLHSLRLPTESLETSLLSPSELWKTWSLDAHYTPHKDRRSSAAANKQMNVTATEPPSTFPVQFLQALKSRKLPAALDAWDAISSKGTLSALGPAQFAEASRQLAIILASTHTDVTSSESPRLRELCLYLALKNESRALLAYLVHLVRYRHLEPAVQVFESFLDSWEQQLEKDRTHNRTEEEPDVPESLLSYATTTGELEATPPLYSDMITTVTIALSLGQNFSSAIRVALRHSRRPSRLSANDILPRLDLTKLQTELAQQYLAHATVAAIAKNTASFRAHIQSLSGSGSGNAQRLTYLYTHILSGLGEEYPWATFDLAHVSSTRPVLIEESTFVHFIKAFCQVGRFDLVEKLWDDLNSLGRTQSVALWTGLIQYTSTVKGADYAQRLWDAMLMSKVQPDALAYQALISAYIHERRMKEAKGKLAELEASLKTASATQDIYSLEPLYNGLLHGHLMSKQQDDALALFEHMKRYGPAPTVATYNTLMAHYTAVRDFKSVSWVLRSMTAEGIQGDGYTYSTLLRALLAVVPREEAIQRALSMMEHQGVEPNVVTYSAIITHLLTEPSESALLAAMDMLKWMEASKRELAPTIVTYTAILQSLHERNFPAAVTKECREYIMRQMRARRIDFTKVTYAVLIKACLANGTADGLRDGLRYFREMQSRKLPISADTWFIVLDGLARRHEWAMANALADELAANGVYNDKQWLNRLVRVIRTKTSIEGLQAYDVELHEY